MSTDATPATTPAMPFRIEKLDSRYYIVFGPPDVPFSTTTHTARRLPADCEKEFIELYDCHQAKCAEAAALRAQIEQLQSVPPANPQESEPISGAQPAADTEPAEAAPAEPTDTQRRRGRRAKD